MAQAGRADFVGKADFVPLPAAAYWLTRDRREEYMMQEKENTEAIRRNYDEAPEREWERSKAAA